MYVGRYVGPPLIWAWQRVPGEVGTAGPESVVVVEDRHYFVGQNDFYVFDGTVPQPLNAPCREMVQCQHQRNLPQQHHRRGGRAAIPIYWHYPSTASGDGSSIAS